LPEWGTVLEVASGSGEHAAYFAEAMPQLAWQPSDPDAEAVRSIEAYRADYGGVNLRAPVKLDASAPNGWPIKHADAIFCANMVHVSLWAATEGLIVGAARLLDETAPLVLYGPYFESGIEMAASNLQFDANLKARNPEWGIRKLEALDYLAEASGFTRTARHEMPANNLMLIYRKG